MLADIGITRADVYSALLTSAGTRASDSLRKAQGQRREAARAQASEARAAARQS